MDRESLAALLIDHDIDATLARDIAAKAFGSATWSPYGVRDTIGGVRERCLDPFTMHGVQVHEGRAIMASPPLGDRQRARVVRGGSWLGMPSHCFAATRSGVTEQTVLETTGFRLVRPLQAGGP